MLTVFGNQPARLILPHDQKKEKPRALLIKCLSKRAIRAWQDKEETARAIADRKERDAAYDALLSEVVTGWENIDGEFSVAAISDAYTLPEFLALLDLIPHAMVPGADDAKKSA